MIYESVTKLFLKSKFLISWKIPNLIKWWWKFLTNQLKWARRNFQLINTNNTFNFMTIVFFKEVNPWSQKYFPSKRSIWYSICREMAYEWYVESMISNRSTARRQILLTKYMPSLYETKCPAVRCSSKHVFQVDKDMKRMVSMWTKMNNKQQSTAEITDARVKSKILFLD